MSALYSMFVNRSDCSAMQLKNSSGDWDYSKFNSPLTEEKLKQHITGDFTLGTYEISVNDTVTWGCDDIDSHNGETDARERVAKVVTVLRKYDLPFLLETSGSPDSYHL